MPNPTGPTAASCSLEQFVSPKLWKHWALSFVLLACGAGILTAAYLDLRGEHSAGPGFSRLFALSTGKTAGYFSTLLLTLAGQLALIIRRVRSLSESDFAGHYRCWGWAAGVWFLFGFAVATDAHWAFSETVLRYEHLFEQIGLWNREVLCWLVPALAAGAVMLWVLHRDMCECRSSLTMLWLSALAGLLAASLVLGIEIAGLDRDHNELIGLGLGLLGHVFLFSSMSLHARHVLYESHDPPESETARPEPRRRFRMPSLRIGIPSLRLRRKRRSPADSEAASDQTPAPVAKSARTRRTAAKTQSANTEPKESAAAKETATSKSAAASENEGAASKPAAGTKPRIRIDPPAKATEPDDGAPSALDDKQSLKGLSKRERRELQKQRREEQRAAQRG